MNSFGLVDEKNNFENSWPKNDNFDQTNSPINLNLRIFL